MGRPDTITMSMRELDRCKVIQAVVEDGLMVWRAAEKLGISKRQIERLVHRYRQDGPRGLVSRKWGQSGHHQLPPGLESRVRGLIRDSYADFGPTLAGEKLRERHGIDLATETVRRIMIDGGFWVPRKLRPPKVHQPREWRKVSASLTLQYDKVMYLLEDRPEHRRLMHRYVEVAEDPDRRIELWADGASLPYTTYDRLSEVDQGAIVDNKRLGHVLQLAQYVQEKRDNTRSLSVPGMEGVPRKRGRPPGKKSQRSLGQNDMLEALQSLQEQPWPLNGTEN